MPLAAVAATREHLGENLKDYIRRSRIGDAAPATLRSLAQTDDEGVMLSIAHLCARRGDHYHELAVSLLDRLLVSSNKGLQTKVMRLAVRTGVKPSHWQRAAKGCAEPLRSFTHARFAAAPLRRQGSWLVEYMSLTGIVPDEQTLLSVRYDPVFVRAAFASKSPALLRTALRLARRRNPEEHAFQSYVLALTRHADPTVRREAYAVLATRDRHLWPSAWLAYEAAFDRDPSVRAVAPDAPTAK